MIGCLWTRVRKQPISALYFESENGLKFYNLEACSTYIMRGSVNFRQGGGMQLSMKFQLLIRNEILKNKDFACFPLIRYCIHYAIKCLKSHSIRNLIIRKTDPSEIEGSYNIRPHSTVLNGVLLSVRTQYSQRTRM